MCAGTEKNPDSFARYETPPKAAPALKNPAAAVLHTSCEKISASSGRSSALARNQAMRLGAFEILP